MADENQALFTTAFDTLATSLVNASVQPTFQTKLTIPRDRSEVLVLQIRLLHCLCKAPGTAPRLYISQLLRELIKNQNKLVKALFLPIRERLDAENTELLDLTDPDHIKHLTEDVSMDLPLKDWAAEKRAFMEEAGFRRHRDQLLLNLAQIRLMERIDPGQFEMLGRRTREGNEADLLDIGGITAEVVEECKYDEDRWLEKWLTENYGTVSPPTGTQVVIGARIPTISQGQPSKNE
ncbi:hypothetical protein LTR66_015396 [Elasticomyces elasticus]|nr:hypothetical protein LTR66_015396 [Elasticomyces elasticus]